MAQNGKSQRSQPDNYQASLLPSSGKKPLEAYHIQYTRAWKLLDTQEVMVCTTQVPKFTVKVRGFSHSVPLTHTAAQ